MSFDEALRRAAGSEAVLTSRAALRAYECDALAAYRALARAVVVPETFEQVRAVLRTCHDHGVPVIARGAGTGLSGGALPHADAVLLSLVRFDRILALDPASRTAVVEPGVRNIAVSEAAAVHGLHYAPDPSSQIACTIGGNVAENSGGVHCLKYGLTVHNVLALTVLLADGSVLETGATAFDRPGYDLTALMCGSEGLLGIVMRATLRLLPVPEHAQVLLAAFDDVARAADGVAAIIAAGIIPAGLEMMDNLALRAAEDYAQAGYPREAAAILLCELDGVRAEVDAELARVERILRSAGAVSVRVAADAAERQRYWLGRKAAFPAMGRIAPDYYCMDGTIPRRDIGRVLERIAALALEYGLPVANVFHAGDGNLHPLIAYDANDADQLRRAEQLGARILEHCVEVGGTITGEHGVGIEKLDQMCVQFSAAELECFHALKRSFDPNGLLNPGKAVPTLARCSELGARHVHHGSERFPHLDRF